MEKKIDRLGTRGGISENGTAIQRSSPVKRRLIAFVFKGFYKLRSSVELRTQFQVEDRELRSYHIQFERASQQK